MPKCLLQQTLETGSIVYVSISQQGLKEVTSHGHTLSRQYSQNWYLGLSGSSSSTTKHSALDHNTTN